MKVVILKCSVCEGIEKLHLADEETICQDGDTVRVLCEICLEAYQTGGGEALEARKLRHG